MCNEYQVSETTRHPVGAVPVVSGFPALPFTSTRRSGVMSKIISAKALASKGASRTAHKFSNKDVVQISNATVPGYTTPVASHTCVVQDETDIPVATGPVSIGLHAGAWKGETLGVATAPTSASVPGGRKH